LTTIVIKILEMQNPTDIEQMIQGPNAVQLPGSLMESFDAYREDTLRTTKEFSPSQLNWYLDLLNRFRGPDDRKGPLLEVFDPEMYTVNHPAWDAPPGTRIQMPALSSEVARFADRNSEFADLAREEIRVFYELAESFADEEVLGLARIAQAALVDQKTAFHGEDAIRYVALNGSALLEDLWGSGRQPMAERSGTPDRVRGHAREETNQPPPKRGESACIRREGFHLLRRRRGSRIRFRYSGFC
jgi:hypothetical protein